MKNKILFILFALTSFYGLSQEEIIWADLTDVKFEKKYFPEYDNYFLYPTFGPSVKDLEGKRISITGYFLDVYPQGDVFVLSKGPFASCFFCGKASPASVMTIYMEGKPKRYKLDAYRRFKGTLQLNHDNPEQFYYILKNAKQID